ncbi:MAG: hypothetical protein AD742_07565 [Methylibium sp. NZG]|nr:MAG: hypothetical protein AD742_07565 [Methylibium sp. NZG]
MDIRKLQRAIVDGLEDVKAQNIVVFNTEHLSPLFERVIIASGTSNRQTKSLASSVRDAVKGSGFPVLRTEGEANGEWIIVDCGAAVVHVMQPSIREYYHLEEIWGDKPVNMKLAAATGKLVKAAEPEAPTRSKAVARTAPAPKAPARKPAAKPAPAKRAPAKQAPAKQAPAKQAPAKRAAAKTTTSARQTAAKAPARKTAPPAGKAVVTRVVGVKRPVAKAAAAPAKTSSPKRAAVAKPAAKKTVARKSPSR